MHANKIETEEEFQTQRVGMIRKAELWGYAERHWLAKLCRTMDLTEAEEIVSIQKAIFMRRLKTDEGIGGAIRFSQIIFNEAYRQYKSGSRRVKPVAEAKCDHCGEPLTKIGNGFMCENDLCDMFDVGVNAANFQERLQYISLDEQLEEGGDDTVVSLGLYTEANEEIKGEYEGEMLDERTILLLENVSEADRKAILAYISNEMTIERAAAANGTNSRSLKRRLGAIWEKIERGQIRAVKHKEKPLAEEAPVVAEVVAPVVVEPVAETAEPAQEEETLEEHTPTTDRGQVVDIAPFTRRTTRPIETGHRRRDPGRPRTPLFPTARASGTGSSPLSCSGGRSQLKRRAGPKQTIEAFRRDYGRFAVY